MTNVKMVRSVNAGVFFGEIAERKSETCVVMRNARRVWYWMGPASLSQLAQEGTTNPEGCKFPTPVDEIEVIGVCEILSVSEKALESLNSVPVWAA